MPERFAILRRLIHQAAESWGIDLIATEEAGFGSHNPNQQAKHNETLGVIRLCGQELGVDVLTYNPGAIKLWLAGHGKADKAMMVAAYNRRYGTHFHAEGHGHDVVDALAILQMALVNFQPPKKPKKTKPPRRRQRAKPARNLF